MDMLRRWSRGSGLDEEGTAPSAEASPPPCAVPDAPPPPPPSTWRDRPLLMRLLTGSVGAAAASAEEVCFGRESAFASPQRDGRGAFDGRVLVQRDVTREGERCSFSCVLQARSPRDGSPRRESTKRFLAAANARAAPPAATPRARAPSRTDRLLAPRMCCDLRSWRRRLLVRSCARTSS